MRIAFVILHYQNTDDTVACIKSLQENLNYEDKKIVVVDNASPNGSGAELQKRYAEDEQVQVLLVNENQGYARGNNLGYQFAKEKLQADFIIVLNNDTIITQNDFCDVIIKKYQEKNYHLLGPDVVDIEGTHQNPHRMELVNAHKLEKVIRNRKLIRWYLKVKEALGWTNSMKLLEVLQQREEQKAKNSTAYQMEKENVVLQGSCIVFSPSYVTENAEAFYSKTFMYFEEDILACKCKEKGYRIVYTPDVSILHKTESSTKYDRSAFQKALFVTEQRIRSAQVFLEYLQNIRTIEKKAKLQILAFHLPQYHTFPENDEWWGEGFTEWVNLKKAKPLYEGHNQPRVPKDQNYYNMLSVDTLQEQAKLSQEYGIDGFCYYHYWFNGKKLMEKPLELLLEHKDINQRYCFCWANESWVRSWTGNYNDFLIEQKYGGEKEWEEHYQYLLPFFSDERYIKVDNKPIFVIYRSNNIDRYEDMILYLKKRAEESGFAGLYIIEEKNFYQSERVSELSDARLHFEPMNTFPNGRTFFEKVVQRLHSDYLNKKCHNTLRYYDYDKVWSALIRDFRKSEDKVFPGAFVDWDNTPRKENRGTVVINGSPEKFGRYMEQLVKLANDKNREFLFINAWNEWTEGAYLEPDEKYGCRYLEEIKRIKDGLKE